MNGLISSIKRFFLSSGIAKPISKLAIRERNMFKFSNESITQIHPTSVIDNATIILEGKSEISIGKNVRISNYLIQVINGKLNISDDCILERGSQTINPSIIINSGLLIMHNNVRLRAKILIRFGGSIKIGEYTAINEGTEIRCDEDIDIGSFNMISYECMIYDTNTHNIYKPEIRRAMTIKDFPNVGEEIEKPKSSSIKIGNDVWVGKRACILKGVDIGNEAIIATNSVISKSVPRKFMAYGNPAITKEIE